MRDAVLTVASGRGAMQSLAVGTPTVAFGSQGVYGLQRGQNLRIGLWGNFGGHPLGGMAVSDVTADTAARLRSEGHTSELQSLMRISYAVVRLKKKKTTTHPRIRRRLER